MIILDTHIWVWWVHGDERLTGTQAEVITTNETDIIGVNAISVWEIAKLVEYNRLELPCQLHNWFYEALSYPGIRLIELIPEIAIESTKLLAWISMDCNIPNTIIRKPATGADQPFFLMPDGFT